MSNRWCRECGAWCSHNPPSDRTMFRVVIAWLLLCLLALVLSACGGGGSSSAPIGHQEDRIEVPAPTPTPRAENVHMTYYAAVPHADGKDGPSSIVETADHIDLAWTGTWGDSATVEGRAALRDLTVKYLQEAKERGITKAMVTVDYFLWVTLGNNHTAYRGSEFVTTEARLLFDRLKAEGLLDMVTVVYPQDEPEIYGIDGTMFCLAISDIRGVLSEYPELAKTKVAVIYAANHGYPGIDCVDIAGFDDYDSRDRIFTNGDYTRFVSMLRADQQTLLVAGGSEPWLQDPTPFYQKAIADNRVYALVGFVWFDQYGQTSYRGIRSAPTRQSFCTVGRHLIGNSTPCL